MKILITGGAGFMGSLLVDKHVEEMTNIQAATGCIGPQGLKEEEIRYICDMIKEMIQCDKN